MIVLGIETSCDETSVAIIEQKENDDFGNILAENTLSQFKKHSKFGGIVPELASREHENTLNILVKKTLNKAKINLKKIDAFAATTGPGLLGGLLIGSNYLSNKIKKQTNLGIDNCRSNHKEIKEIYNIKTY